MNTHSIFQLMKLHTNALQESHPQGTKYCITQRRREFRLGKGQLISKCLFEKIVWTKIPTKNLIDSAQQV